MPVDWKNASLRKRTVKAYVKAAEAGTSLDTVAAKLGVGLDALRHGLKSLKHEGLIKPYQSYLAPRLTDGIKETLETGSLINGTPYTKVTTSDSAEMVDILTGSDDLDRFKVSKYTRNLKRKWVKGHDGKLIELKEWSQTAYFGLTDQVDAIKELHTNFLADIKPTNKKCQVKSNRFAKRTAVVEIPDFHLGNLVWSQECDEDWDLGIAEDLYRTVFQNLVDRAMCGKDVNHVVLVFGNDFIHTDNKENQTTAGTQLSMDSRWAKVYKLGGDLQLWAVDYARKCVPKTTVVYVPGNHDELTAFALGDMVERYYSNVDDVIVMNSPKLRKYLRVGCTLIGWTHGNNEKKTSLPMLLMREAKDEVPKCDFFEFHLGHWHHRVGSLVREDYIDIEGVTVRTMPTLTPSDDWHTKKGLTLNSKAAEVYVYDEDAGLCEIIVAQRKVNLRQKK